MRKPSIDLAINITESEKAGRIILHWSTWDKSVGGNFDVTEIALFAFSTERQRIRDKIKEELWQAIAENHHTIGNEALEGLNRAIQKICSPSQRQSRE